MNKNNTQEKSPLKYALSFAFFSVVLGLLAVIMTYLTVTVFEGIKNKTIDADMIDADMVQEMPTIIIDAGHGGEDGGAGGKNGIIEKDLNLEIAFLLRDMLRASGINVIMTRTEDVLLYDRNADYMGHKKSLDLRARLDIAKSVPNSIFISIHMNAFPSEKYSGLQVWYSRNNGESKLLAEIIQSTVKAKLQPENNRKIKAADSSIYLLDRAPWAAVLVECGFLSNENEAEKLSDPLYRQSLAFLLFSAITEYSINNSCK